MIGCLFYRKNHVFTQFIPWHKIRWALLLAVFIFAIYHLMDLTSKLELQNFNRMLKGDLYCYRKPISSLKDISDTHPKGKSIFFHETSCNSYEKGEIYIKRRQACAVESAALLNPDYDVYLLFVSPGKIKSDPLIQTLESYKNIKIMHLNIDRYFNNSPLSNILWDGRLEKSKWASSHTSDALRFLTLWKYGGIYLDLDIIVLRNFDSLPENFVAAQFPEEIAAGVIAFGKHGFGPKFAKMSIYHLAQTFDGTIWGRNGPEVAEWLSKKLCSKQAYFNETYTCEGFTVFPSKRFYGVPYPEWEMFFRESDTNEVLERTKDSYALHLWNKLSEGTQLPLNSTAAYLLYAKKYCPKIIGKLRDYF